MQKPRSLVSLVLGALPAAAQTIPDIRDSLEPLALPDPTFRVAIWIASSVAILLAAIAIWWFRFRKLQSVPESAEARAHRRLDTISAAAPRAFYTELHDIFIEYLESRALSSASRRTTPELVDALQTTSLQLDWRLSAATFLNRCDYARFSPAYPDFEPATEVAECRNLIRWLAASPGLSGLTRKSA